MQTIWKEVKGYEGLYEINEFGQIRKTIKPVKGLDKIYSGGGLIGGGVSWDYHRVKLWNHRRVNTNHSVHVLVAEAFVPNPDNKPVVNHKDGNKLNNHYTNLEWVTRSENVQHAVDTGLLPVKKGEKHGNAKVTEDDVKKIRLDYIHSDKSSREIASEFGLSYGATCGIINGKYWKHQELPLPKDEYFKKVAEKDSKLRSTGQRSRTTHPTRKLTKDEIIEMRRLWDSGEVTKKNQLAKQFNMHPSTIKDILDRKIHKYI